MNIIKCKICRKAFHSLGGTTCPECVKKIDMDFITVRDYIYDNPHSTIDQVAEDTEVEKAVILHLLKEGRLTLETPDAEGLLTCEVCRKPITSGRMCDSCKSKVASTMNSNIERNRPPEPEKKDLKASKHNAKMHTDISRNRQ